MSEISQNTCPQKTNKKLFIIHHQDKDDHNKSENNLIIFDEITSK